MTSLAAYHFPDTALGQADLRPQLLFFSQIFILAPFEPDSAEPDELCPTYTPAPLGPDLPRFKQLLTELKGNEAAFYQGHMSRMALEYMENRDPKSVLAIISHLHNPGPSHALAQAAAKEREELWQARLLLKLAEVLRLEEKALAEGMAALAERQAELFQALKGEELDDILDVLAEAAPSPMPVRTEALLKAWGRLLLAGDRRPWFITCSSPTTAEPFFEANESLSGQRPVRLLRLPLPNGDQEPVELYLDKRHRWFADLATCRQNIADLLTEIAQQGLAETSLAELSRLAAVWTTAGDQTTLWPSPTAPSAEKCGAVPHLEIYLLNTSLAALLAKLCGRSPEPAADGPGHALLALLSTRSSTCKG